MTPTSSSHLSSRPRAARPGRVARRRLVATLLLLPLAGLGAACSASSPASSAPPQPVSVVEAAPITAPTTASSGSAAVVARPAADTDVYDAPGDPSPNQQLPARTEFGSPLALVVVDDAPGWLRVQLPTRPNGSTGWIRADGVELRRVELAVHVDVDARRLVVTDRGQPVLETPVAVGADGTPTPRGTFSIVDKLETGRPDGAYGPFAFGLSAHSDVLTEFAGGDGQVGIHGTADPGSIGAAVSNGCIRVPNEVAVALDELLPLGTPVTIA